MIKSLSLLNIAVTCLLVLVFHSPQVFADDKEDISPRLEELARAFSQKHHKQLPLENMAWKTLSPDEQENVYSAFKSEVRVAEETEAQKQFRNLYLSNTGEGFPVLDLNDKAAFKTLVNKILAVYKSGLISEKINKIEIDAKVKAYEVQLRKVAFEDLRSQTSEDHVLKLADVFASSVKNAVAARQNGNGVAAENYSAISLKLLTDAYLLSGLTAGTRQGRVKRALTISTLATWSSLVLFLTLPRSALSLPIAAVFVSSAISMFINRSRLNSKSTSDAFFPDPLVRGPAQNENAKELIDAFWKRAERTLLSSLKPLAVSPFIFRQSGNGISPDQKPHPKVLEEYTAFLSKISGLSYEDLVAKYMGTTKELLSCNYKLWRLLD